MLAVAVPTMVVATITARYLPRRRLAVAREHGECLQPAVLVGDARAVLELARRIGAAPRTTGLEVRGVCVTELSDPALSPEEFSATPVLGMEADTLDVVDRLGAEVVAVASGPSLTGQPLRRLGWALEQRNVDLLIDPGVIEVAGPRLTLRRASGLPMRCTSSDPCATGPGTRRPPPSTGSSP